MRRLFNIRDLLVAGLITAGLTSCSTKDDESSTDSTASGTTTSSSGGSSSPVLETEDVSLDKMPDLSSLVSASDSTSLALAVSGTPAKIREMADNYDAIFYGGAVAAVNTAGSATQEQRNKLERGDALCRMTENIAQAFKGLMGGTLCYMRNITSATNGLETPDDYDLEQLFAPETDDKHVQIKLKQSGQIGMIANMKIKGTTSSPDAYDMDFYMCQRGDDGAFSVHEKQHFVVNYTKGTYEVSSSNSGEEDGQSFAGIETITAYLKSSDGGLVFDMAKDRTLSRQFSSTFGSWTSKGVQDFVMNADDEVISKIYGLYSSTGEYASSGSDKIYSIARSSGAGKNIALPEAGMKMQRTWTFNNQSNTMTAFGAVEWQDTTYQDTETSDIYTTVNDFDISADSYFDAEPESPTIDFTGIDCSTEGDTVVTWDLESQSFQDADADCSGQSSDGLGSFNNVCSGTAIQQALQTAYSNNQ